VHHAEFVVVIIVGSLAYRCATYIHGQIRDGFAARLAIASSWSGGAVPGGSLWGKFEKLLPRSPKKIGKPIINEISDFEIELCYFFRLRLILLLEAFFVPRPNATRIPSIADEVATDLVTVLSRTAGLRR